MFRRFIILASAAFFLTSAVYAEEITVASGAGFKRMVTDIAGMCESDYGLKMNMSFGNLGQVLAQIKTTGLIQAVVGDRSFFEKAGIRFSETHLIGNGKLVLAWRKGLTINDVHEITGGDIKRIAIPDLEKAIYGKAGAQFLESSGMLGAVQDKLYVVSTVPQVTSYLVTGEVDAGFSNLTDIMGAADKVGGYIVIEDGYSRIDIITGVLHGSEKSEGVNLYRKCVTSEKARTIAEKHGL